MVRFLPKNGASGAPPLGHDGKWEESEIWGGGDGGDEGDDFEGTAVGETFMKLDRM